MTALPTSVADDLPDYGKPDYINDDAGLPRLPVYPIDYDRYRYDDEYDLDSPPYPYDDPYDDLADDLVEPYDDDYLDGRSVHHLDARASGDRWCYECGGPLDTNLFQGVCRGCAKDHEQAQRLADAEEDEYDALIDGKPRW